MALGELGHGRSALQGNPRLAKRGTWAFFLAGGAMYGKVSFSVIGAIVATGFCLFVSMYLFPFFAAVVAGSCFQLG